MLTLFSLVALLLYCLGLGGVLLRSRLVTDAALELPPTFTATSTPAATAPATPGPTSTPTATLPPTPTQRPIPTSTPTPESVNITVVITSTDGLTSTVVVSATVTPTPVLTPTVTITAETSLGSSYLEADLVAESGIATGLHLDETGAVLRPAILDRAASDWNALRLAAGQDTVSACCPPGTACWVALRRGALARTPQQA